MMQYGKVGGIRGHHKCHVMKTLMLCRYANSLVFPVGICNVHNDENWFSSCHESVLARLFAHTSRRVSLSIAAVAMIRDPPPSC